MAVSVSKQGYKIKLMMKNEKLKIELADRSDHFPCIDFEDEVEDSHFGSDVFKPYLVLIGKQLLAKKILQV